MDAGNIKLRDNIARAGYARPGATVRTELAPSQSVTAAATAVAAQAGAASAEASLGLIDPQTHHLLDRERDVTRRNSRRAPDEALSRMRAYGRSAAKDDPAEQEDHADLKA